MSSTSIAEASAAHGDEAANRPSLQKVTDELCLLLSERYWDDRSVEDRARLEEYLPFASPCIRSLCSAYLSLALARPSETLSSLTDFIEKWISSHSVVPSPEAVELFRSRLDWLDDEDSHQHIKELALSEITKRMNDRWPLSAPAVYVRALTDTLASDEGEECDDRRTIETMSAVLRIDQHYWPASSQIAESYVELGEYAAAIPFFCKVFNDCQSERPLVTELFQYAYCCAKAGDFESVRGAMQQYLNRDPGDTDAIAVIAHTRKEVGDTDGWLQGLRQMVPVRTKRRFWLWVTKPDYYKEDDGRDRVILDPIWFGGAAGPWSCDERTIAGDFVLLWRTHPCSDIGYLLIAETDAYEPEEFDWPNGCDFRSLYKFDNPITMADLRADQELATWPAFRSQFRGSNFEIPEEIWGSLLSLACRKNPDFAPLADLLKRI